MTPMARIADDKRDIWSSCQLHTEHGVPLIRRRLSDRRCSSRAPPEIFVCTVLQLELHDLTRSLRFRIAQEADLIR